MLRAVVGHEADLAGRLLVQPPVARRLQHRALVRTILPTVPRTEPKGREGHDAVGLRADRTQGLNIHIHL